MKILLVHADKTPWATQRRAEALKREWKDDEVDIAYLKDLPDGEPYDVIHFLFSGGIGKCKDYILKHKEKVFTTLASQRTLDGYFDTPKTLREVFLASVACVCQNPRLLSAYKTLTNCDNGVYIPNGVDTEFFKRDFTVGYVGAKDSAEHKGLPIIKEVCYDLGLTLKIASLPYEEMPEFYKGIDCLVLMSQSEGCNNPTLEALAMNKPVITTDVGIVDAKDLLGITIVERNSVSLKEALKKMFFRDELISWEEIAKQYRELYVRALGS